VKREPTLPVHKFAKHTQAEVANNSGTSPSLSLTHSLPTLKIAKTKNRTIALLFMSHCVVAYVDYMRRRHSHLYIGVEWSVVGNIP